MQMGEIVNRYLVPALMVLALLTACAKPGGPAKPADTPTATTAQDRETPSEPNYTPASPSDMQSDPQAPTDIVTHDLEGTRWVHMEIAGQAVSVNDQQREQYIVLESMEHHVVGNAGCNRLRGSYALDAGSLAFSQLGTTRMACPDMDRETALLKALESTASWRIEGAYLELFDGSGATLARFESRNL